MSEKDCKARRSAEETRDAILCATRRIFAEKGYDRATVRAIAKLAGCDPALVIRYFGSKRELFNRVVASPFEDFPDARPGDTETLVSVAGKLLETWHTDPVLLGMFRAASSDAEAAETMRRFFEARVRPHQARTTGLSPDRALCFGAMLIGLVWAREITRIPPLSDMTSREIAAMAGGLLRTDGA